MPGGMANTQKQEWPGWPGLLDLQRDANTPGGRAARITA